MSDKSLKIYFNIQDRKPDNDDVLLAFSEIKKIKTYKEIIEYQLNSFFNNKENLQKNLNELSTIINERLQYLKIIKLSKWGKDIYGKSFLEGNNTSKNNVFVFYLDDFVINSKKFNQIAIWVDVKHNKNQDNSTFVINAKRIEFYKNNFKSQKKQQKTIEFACEFELDSDIETQPIILKENVKLENVFDDDDYNEDSLKLKDWSDFLNDLKEIYGNKNDQISTRLIKFNNYFWLVSKTRVLAKNNNEQPILKNETNDYKEFKIKSFNFDQNFQTNIKEFFNYLQDLEQENTNRINKCDLEISKLNKKINEIWELIRKKESTINETKSKIKNIENKLNENKKDIDKLQQNKELLKKSKKFIENPEIKAMQENIKKINEDKKVEENYLKNLENELINDKENLKVNDKNYKDQENNKSQLEKWNLQINLIKNYIEKERFEYIYKLEENGINFKQGEDEASNELDKLLNDLDDYYLNQKQDIDLSWYITTSDIAIFTKIKRLNFAINQLQQGYYKNFNLYKSIKKPSKIFYSSNIDDSIKNKYTLNLKQESAVKKAINTNDLFYLQGPPGTGKTQVLCAIAESIIKSNENLVMCSSTHEAIDNFLERLHSFNKDNPNLVIFKYRFSASENKDKDSFFSEDNLFRNWKNAIYEKLSPTSRNSANNLWNIYIKNYGKEIPKNLIKNNNLWILPKSFLELIKKNLKFINENIEIIKKDSDEYIRPIDFYGDKIQEEAFPHFFNSYNKFIEILNDDSLKQIQLFDEVINSLVINSDDILLNLIKYLKNVDSKNFFNLIQKKVLGVEGNENKQIDFIRNYYSNQVEGINSCENEFKNYILEKELINVIGISTTSRLNIKLNNNEKSLFNEYQIDTMLIDEVSKSSTPEIISKAILAKKIILSGDYLQLPPNPEFNDKKTITKLIDLIGQEDQNDLESEIKELEEYIEELFKTSFFVTQVNKIKNKNNPNDSAYEFLQESRRFSGNILDIVNLIYPKDEKLIKVPHEEKKYFLKINNRNYDSDLVICDISYPSLDFFKQDHEMEKVKFEKSFDQSGKPFIVKNKEIKSIDLDTRYNQYSARVILELVNNLIKQNELSQEKRIGIITLTRNQKFIINDYLSLFCENKNYKNFIKVDTIDNFQGREEEIIIVDFIRGLSKIDNRKVNTPKKRNLSFLEQIERINVALSRAKNKLILVGFFDEYLKDLEIKDRGRLFNEYLNLCKNKSDSYIEFSKEVE